MLMKYQDEQFYSELSIHAPLIFEVWMVMLSLTYPPWCSITDKNLNIFISEFSDFNRKLSSLEKLHLLQDFSFSSLRHCQRVTNQSIHCAQYEIFHNISWQQRKICCLHRRKIHGLYRYLEMIGSPTKLTTSGQRSNNFGPHLQSELINHLSRQLFHLFTWYRRLFENAVEVLDTRLMPASYTDLN